jgi:hypothetical protein
MKQNQAQLRDEFREAYGVEISSIDSETGELFFNYENLQTLIYTMGAERIRSSYVNAYQNGETDISETTLELTNGQSITRLSSVSIGTKLTNGETIESHAQASGLAKINSLRECLSAIGFNPLRIHNARKPQDQTPDEAATDNVDELATEVETLAKATGYISETNGHAAFYTLIKSMYDANGLRALTATQLNNLALFLRADLKAKARAHAA